MAQGISFEFGMGKSRPSSANGDDEGFKVLVLGDFCGIAATAGGELRKRPLRQADIDNFDALMATLRPEIALEGFGPDGRAEHLVFEKLDDFHPDELFRRFEPLRALRNLRARLVDPATFREAARELENAAPAQPSTPADPVPAAESGSLFDQLIGKEPTAERPVSQSGASVADRLIANLVMPYLGQSVDIERQSLLVKALDAAIGDTLRQILQAPAFQRMEGIWRSLHWLINRVENSEAVKIFPVPATQEELAEDFRLAGGDTAATGLALNLLSQAELHGSGGSSCLLVGDYRFGADGDGIKLLGHLGTLARRMRGVFIAGGEPDLVGLSGGDDPGDSDVYRRGPKPPAAWAEFRKSSVSQRVALAWPRFILRFPYGKRSDPIESFEFEEMPGTPEQQAYLWGNGGILCAGLIVASAGDGYGRQEVAMEIGDFPCHVYASDNGRVMRPATEFLLGEAAVETVLKAGLIPLLGAARWNVVRLARLQTVAEPPTDPIAALF